MEGKLDTLTLMLDFFNSLEAKIASLRIDPIANIEKSFPSKYLIA